MKKYAFFILSILAGSMLFAQSNIQKINTYHCIMNLDQENEQIMKNNGIELAKLVEGRFIDPNSNDKFNEASFRRGIEELFPNARATGVGIIDWETATFDNLCNSPANSQSFKNALQIFTHIIDVAKSMRPNVKWGIYNLPYCRYWQRDNAMWNEQGNKLKPLFDKTDLLMLSLYDFYEDGAPAADDESYIKDNMQLSLKIANKMNKPLLVFVWDRYHNSNEKKGLQLIPEQEFAEHVFHILDQKVNGRGVDGLVWFDAPDWFYSQNSRLADDDARLLSINRDRVKTTAIKHYGQIIADLVSAENLNNSQNQ